MRIEVVIPDTHRLGALHTPREASRVGHATPYFTAWVYRYIGEAYHSDYGRGDTPQAAVDEAIVRLEASLTGAPRKLYNDIGAPRRTVPAIELDLTDILKDL